MASDSTNAQLFKQVDQLSRQLCDARLEAQRANERARRTKKHGENLQVKFREARTRAETFATSLPFTERQRLLETFDMILHEAEPVQEDGASMETAQVSGTHVADIETNTEVSGAVQDVVKTSCPHASALSSAAVSPPCENNDFPPCENNQSSPEDLRQMHSHTNSTITEAEWQPNTSKCALCNSTFTVFRRRHHCRNCGSCVCAECSPFRVHLESFAQRPARSNSVGRIESFVQRPTRSGSVGSLFDAARSKSNFEPMSRPVARRICTGCHGVGVGSFVGQR
jgi:hypothetical protein